jgi:hypothetical protein
MDEHKVVGILPSSLAVFSVNNAWKLPLAPSSSGMSINRSRCRQVGNLVRDWKLVGMVIRIVPGCRMLWK